MEHIRWEFNKDSCYDYWTKQIKVYTIKLSEIRLVSNQYGISPLSAFIQDMKRRKPSRRSIALPPARCSHLPAQRQDPEMSRLSA